jgi:hypothetical protein
MWIEGTLYDRRPYQRGLARAPPADKEEFNFIEGPDAL